MTLIFAHRGSAGTHPENTFAAYLEAERVGVDGIELDVQLTKDNQIVVIHDSTVNRTTNGIGKVKDYTLEEIKQLDNGSWFAPEFDGEKVPTLTEVLEWLQTNKLLLNIELKNETNIVPYLEELVIKEIEKHNLVERVIISSFNHYSIRKINKLNSKIECAILFLEKLYEPWNYATTVRAKGLHSYNPKTSDAMIREAQERGYPVRVFTVNKEERMQQLIAQGCSAIFTDYPERALQVREVVRG
ncbi:glycerophosphodiester phosphodiesterase [Virgibacillus halodenitrificans]|uniref:glycerophosphodiester phosphodiesterase n=1 Tax=Virgibacillus halodenitrificans TaxID=1482 RepID=UPI000310121F|nr:glycerophosphodiester phosphodiesterase [Virgibacillus halodenitrificans]MYL46716.1 glycerophosphodiester phosphodiesterase [Virgibacillus halodenitrificans]MYL57975.1 glycerophosphodiester phosphodiesterase [Virgibacillus halodenitrificans]